MKSELKNHHRGTKTQREEVENERCIIFVRDSKMMHAVAAKSPAMWICLFV
jgi:hypothetical protein